MIYSPHISIIININLTCSTTFGNLYYGRFCTKVCSSIYQMVIQ